jgi:acyl-coenzyme A thioesterase PaaI-like protein
MHLIQTPCAAAMGMTAPQSANGRATASLPPSPRLAGPDGGFHPLALLPFLDELASNAILSLGLGSNGMATIELRLDFPAAPGPLSGPLTGTAHALSGPPSAQLAHAEARNSAGTLIATAQAWFATGTYPGPETGSAGMANTPPRDWGPGPFEPLVGLERLPQGARLHPADAAIGWTGLPAVHGGIVAVLLAAAAQQAHPGTLAALTVRYLKAVPATGATATAHVRRPGRRTAHVAATLTSPAGGPTLAEADALFIA